MCWIGLSHTLFAFWCCSHPFYLVLCENHGSGETESREKGEGGGVGMGSVGSAEANNWGMDDSIDVNAVRRDEDQPACREVGCLDVFALCYLTN